MTLWHGNLQGVLEKFEFFPIKCRILRATERYSQFLAEQVGGDRKEPRKLKIKVLLDSSAVAMQRFAEQTQRGCKVSTHCPLA